jgi:hypothetical protein
MTDAPKASSRQNPNETGSIRPQTATQNATRVCQPAVVDDPELAAVVSAWPELPEAIRTGIVAMSRASSEKRSTE